MNRYFKRSLLAFAVCLLIPVTRAVGQYNSYQLSVAVEATIQEQPPRITLNWLKDDSATKYFVMRYDADYQRWSTAVPVGKALTWTDTDVSIGVPYEYCVTKLAKVGTSTVSGYGYAYTGIDVPAVDFNGTVVLMVDDTFASALSTELNRWKSDLIADGWHVIRHDVKRSDSVEKVKRLVLADLQQDPTVRSLFLFGHVPVPYSGFLHPDGHPNHYGAWPADVYYGDTLEDYTDEINDTTTKSSIAANINLAHDGKFDQSTTANGFVQLEIGRVDFWDMPDFKLSEKELLRQYLNKDHAFRTGTLTAPKRALVSDNFGSYGEGFACDAWRNYANLVGGKNINQLGWFTTLDTAAYLWAYGCGGGSFTSAGGIGSTTDFAATDTKAIFTMLFGSYFGDWNVENSFLRSPLTSSTTLTCCWAGRPHWYVHHMAMGETIGYSTALTQNCPVGNLYDQVNYGSEPIVQGVHIALMGDPTLKMEYKITPSDFVSIHAQSTNNNHAVNLTWSTATPAEGYNVYRSHHWGDNYDRLTTLPTASLSFTDTDPFPDSNYYIVRAVSKDGGSHGTYYTDGMASNPVSITGLADVSDNSSQTIPSIRIAQDGPSFSAIVTYTTESPARLSMFDESGREVAVLDPSLHGAGTHQYTLDTRGLLAGVYFVRLLSPMNPLMTKVVIVR